MCEYLLEACVETLKEAQNAEKMGAHRIELCSQLHFDGLTPDINLFRQIVNSINIPVKVMIRPRKGNFEYDKNDINQIILSVEQFKFAGAKSIVFGAIKNNRLDLQLIQQVANLAFPMNITVHKAIDHSHNIDQDIQSLKSIANVNAILSSGQAPQAEAAIDRLKEMKFLCGDNITLIVAGKVTQQNIEWLHSKIGAKEYHGRKIVA